MTYYWAASFLMKFKVLGITSLTSLYCTCSSTWNSNFDCHALPYTYSWYLEGFHPFCYSLGLLLLVKCRCYKERSYYNKKLQSLSLMLFENCQLLARYSPANHLLSVLWECWLILLLSIQPSFIAADLVWKERLVSNVLFVWRDCSIVRRCWLDSLAWRFHL